MPQRERTANAEARKLRLRGSEKGKEGGGDGRSAASKLKRRNQVAMKERGERRSRQED